MSRACYRICCFVAISLCTDEIEADASEFLETVTLLPSASIAEAIAQLDKAGTGALVLCTADRMLIGLLTDGDIRRAILRGVSLETPCENIASLESR